MNYFITGTDTNAGKTFAACILLEKIYKNYKYFKPVQTGWPRDDDARTVRSHLKRYADDRVREPLFRYRGPYSPHLAMEREPQAERIPDVERLTDMITEAVRGSWYLIEGAGGLLVPVTREYTWIDVLLLLKKKGFLFKVILAARTGLGTINHTLLSIRELERNGIECEGLFFCGPLRGDPYEDNINFLKEKTGYRVIAAADPEDYA